MDSILQSVKNYLGGELFVNPEEATPFDSQLIDDINAALMIVNQIGVGQKGFIVTSADETWSDFLGDNNNDKELVRLCVNPQVKLMFDPPSSSTLIKLLQDQILEYECRLKDRVELNI